MNVPSNNKRKRSHRERYNKNKKLKWDASFDSSQHRTQQETRGLSTDDKVYYLNELWTSVPICSTDRISKTNQQNISTRDLLIETLLKEMKSRKNSFKSVKIPSTFLSLIDTEIIGSSVIDNPASKRSWIALGKWLGFESYDKPLKKKQIRRYIKLKWKKLNAATLKKSQKQRKKLIESARKVKSIKELAHFRHVKNLECITDLSGQTLIHLKQLEDLNAVKLATNTINEYYNHLVKDSSHQSKSFKNDLVEHFGAYTLNNLLPYTSADTACTHNPDHLVCVNKLIQGLKPLSESVNQFAKDSYNNLYLKLKDLSWGPFAPRLFGIFLMIAINFNIASDYHWDHNDEPNGLCFLVPLGDFEGGELCFPEFQIVIPLQPGQVVTFASRLLFHGNLPIIKGIRFSVVYFIHAKFFKHYRDFSKVYQDYKTGIDRNANGIIISKISHQDLNNNPNNQKIKKIQKIQKNSKKIQNKRRAHIDLTRAHLGLRAQDPISKPY